MVDQVHQNVVFLGHQSHAFFLKLWKCDHGWREWDVAVLFEFRLGVLNFLRELLVFFLTTCLFCIGHRLGGFCSCLFARIGDLASSLFARICNLACRFFAGVSDFGCCGLGGLCCLFGQFGNLVAGHSQSVGKRLGRVPG